MSNQSDPRPDWHDQDLVTNREAAGRLSEEADATRTRLRALAPDDPARPATERRLRAIEEVLKDLRGS
jgi:hypothetical protein